MPTRIYLCPIIGRGTENDPQRAAIGDDLNVTACRSVISVHRFSGLKRFGWTICRVVASDFGGVDAIEGAIHIPKAALDVAIPEAKRLALQERLGGDVTIPAGATVRQVIRRLVKAHYAHADEETVL